MCGLRSVALLGFFALAACESGKRQNRPLPDEFRAVTLTDDLLDKSTLAGQPWVISVWRPDCKACLAQLHVLDQVKAKHAQDRVGFVALSLDTDEHAIFDAAARAELDSTLAYGDEVMGPLGLKSLPSTVFLDASAVIVASVTGEASEATLEKWLQVASK